MLADLYSPEGELLGGSVVVTASAADFVPDLCDVLVSLS
jgi:hypothetical protein